MKAKYIAFDCETTGIDLSQAELLTGYFLFLDAELNPVHDLELFCKPNEGLYYKVNPEAMKVNKIDLISHNEKAISYESARNRLKNLILSLLSEQAIKAILAEKEVELSEKLIPIGHFFTFDVAFLKKFLMPDWDSFIDRKGLDTASIAMFLKSTGQLPANLSTSLIKLAEHYGIPHKGAHDAKFDTVMTVEVLKGLRKTSMLPVLTEK